MNSLAVRVVLPTSEVNWRYDLLVATLGFEHRATAVASTLRDRSEHMVALGFNHNQLLAYRSNEAWFKSAGFQVEDDLSTKDFAESFTRNIRRVSEKQSGSAPPRIAVDVSCLDRLRLAAIIDILRTLDLGSLTVDFFYSIAAFIPPSPVLGRNEVAGPVHRRFAGRFLDPGRPLALIAGLGYEIGKVMGAAEYVQASRVIAFVPQSPVTQYEKEVVTANSLLLDELAQRDVMRYEVDDPVRTVAALDAVVRGLKHSHNIVILPGGPKMFALCCLLIQTLHREVSVWRVSSGSSIVARDVNPSGHVVGLRAEWTPKSEPDSSIGRGLAQSAEY